VRDAPAATSPDRGTAVIVASKADAPPAGCAQVFTTSYETPFERPVNI
jgi:hypothetical protein